MKQERTAAIVTIKKAKKMTKRGRCDIATWLRHLADELIKEGDKFADGFRARYIY